MTQKTAGQARTEAAREAARLAYARKRHERWASEMERYGWTMKPPTAYRTPRAQ